MKLIQVLENIKNDDNMFIYDKVDILYQIYYEHDVYDVLEQIVDDEQINMTLKYYINELNSWESAFIFMRDIKEINKPYYYLNGYGNLENLTADKFDIILDDFIQEVKYKGLENVEVNYNE